MSARSNPVHRSRRELRRSRWAVTRPGTSATRSSRGIRTCSTWATWCIARSCRSRNRSGRSSSTATRRSPRPRATTRWLGWPKIRSWCTRLTFHSRESGTSSRTAMGLHGRQSFPSISSRKSFRIGTRGRRLGRGIPLPQPPPAPAVESHPKQRNPVQVRHGDWTHAMQLEARPVGFPDSVRAMGVAPLTVGSDLKGVTPWIREAAIKEPVNVLALSGGGAGGAFGAGALVGWTRAGTRQEFQVVTGVSVGALVAPFAFLGSAWDDKLREAFSGGRTDHLLQRRWSDALFGSSLYRGQPLASLVDSYITIEMVRAIGVEAAKGRLLLVATTKLDTE